MRFDSHAPPRHLTTADFPVYMSLCAAALCADPASPLRKAPLTHKVKSFAAAHSAHYQTGLTCISRAPCLSEFELLPGPLPSRPSFERRTSGEEEEEEEKEEKEEKDTTVPEEEEVVEEEAAYGPSECSLLPTMSLPLGDGALTVEEHMQMQDALHGGETPGTAFTLAGGDETLQETCTDAGRSTLRGAAIGQWRLKQRSSMCLQEVKKHAERRRQQAELWTLAEQAVQQVQVQQQAQRKQMARYQAECEQKRADAGTLSLSLDEYLALTREEYRQRQAPALALKGGDACLTVASRPLPLQPRLPEPSQVSQLTRLTRFEDVTRFEDEVAQVTRFEDDLGDRRIMATTSSPVSRIMATTSSPVSRIQNSASSPGEWLKGLGFRSLNPKP